MAIVTVHIQSQSQDRTPLFLDIKEDTVYYLTFSVQTFFCLQVQFIWRAV